MAVFDGKERIESQKLVPFLLHVLEPLFGYYTLCVPLKKMSLFSTVNALNVFVSNAIY